MNPGFESVRACNMYLVKVFGSDLLVCKINCGNKQCANLPGLTIPITIVIS